LFFPGFGGPVVSFFGARPLPSGDNISFVRMAPPPLFQSGTPTPPFVSPCAGPTPPQSGPSPASLPPELTLVPFGSLCTVLLTWLTPATFGDSFCRPCCFTLYACLVSVSDKTFFFFFSFCCDDRDFLALCVFSLDGCFPAFICPSNSSSDASLIPESPAGLCVKIFLFPVKREVFLSTAPPPVQKWSLYPG